MLTPGRYIGAEEAEDDGVPATKWRQDVAMGVSRRQPAVRGCWYDVDMPKDSNEDAVRGLFQGFDYSGYRDGGTSALDLLPPAANHVLSHLSEVREDTRDNPALVFCSSFKQSCDEWWRRNKSG